jgi:hypothetical protein
MTTGVKLHDLRSAQVAFNRRSRERAVRMQGLVSLFQSGEITVKKFRHLTALLKAEHKTDCRESGSRVESQFT